jgi:hypothetical protein
MHRSIVPTVPVLRAALCGASMLFTLPASAQRRPEPPGPPEGDSPVALEVRPSRTSSRWAFALINRGSSAVEVVVDRNLLWLEISAGTSTSPRSARRRAVRCRGPLFPLMTEGLSRVTLSPDARREEGFDLQTLCGLRLPATLVRGAILSWRYGARGARPSWSRAVVLGAGASPIDELRAEPTELAFDPAALVPEVPEPPAGPLRVRVAGDVTGDRASDGFVRVFLEGADASPRRMYFRPSMFSLELLSPRGARTHCVDAPAGYVGLPEDLRTVSSGRSAAATLSLGALCPSGALDEPGIYRGVIRFDHRVDPAGRTVFVPPGPVRSRPFWISIRRGRAGRPYAPLDTSDPFNASGGPS